jgi:hypothetical protein
MDLRATSFSIAGLLGTPHFYVNPGGLTIGNTSLSESDGVSYLLNASGAGRPLDLASGWSLLSLPADVRFASGAGIIPATRTASSLLAAATGRRERCLSARELERRSVQSRRS